LAVPGWVFLPGDAHVQGLPIKLVAIHSCLGLPGLLLVCKGDEAKALAHVRLTVRHNVHLNHLPVPAENVAQGLLPYVGCESSHKQLVLLNLRASMPLPAAIIIAAAIAALALLTLQPHCQ
jgi:hypothetical protein